MKANMYNSICFLKIGCPTSSLTCYPNTSACLYLYLIYLRLFFIETLSLLIGDVSFNQYISYTVLLLHALAVQFSNFLFQTKVNTHSDWIPEYQRCGNRKPGLRQIETGQSFFLLYSFPPFEIQALWLSLYYTI